MQLDDQNCWWKLDVKVKVPRTYPSLFAQSFDAVAWGDLTWGDLTRGVKTDCLEQSTVRTYIKLWSTGTEHIQTRPKDSSFRERFQSQSVTTV